MVKRVKNNFNPSKGLIAFIIGACTLLLFVVGAAYAYFIIDSNNFATTVPTTGALYGGGEVVLETNISSLYLNLNAALMSEENIGTTYYAIPDPSGIPVTNPFMNNGIYVLATATANEAATGYDCIYTYGLSGTVGEEINDGSDEDIKVTLRSDSLEGGFATYSLKEILEGDKKITGEFKEISYTKTETITIESTVENSDKGQNDFEGNNYSITLTAESFSCGYTVKVPKVQTALSKDEISLTVTHGTYQLKDMCINDDPIDTSNCDWIPITDTVQLPTYGTYYAHVRDVNDYIGHSGKVTHYQTLADKLIDDGNMWQSGLEGDGYRFIGSGGVGTDTTPNNFICFGTTSATTCKGDENKYLYRVIGVFPDSEGNYHAKLFKYFQLPSRYPWHSNYKSDVKWEESDLYKGINGDYFLTNPTYGYLQSTVWSGKISDWPWTAVNTKTASDGGPNYNAIPTTEMYLHEHNRSTKPYAIGEWTTPVAKIGLIYASDYMLALGESSFSYTSNDYTTLKKGWVHQSNNSGAISNYEWTLSRRGSNNGSYHAWLVFENGRMSIYYVNYSFGVSPAFYLYEKATYKDGTGTYEDPITIG